MKTPHPTIYCAEAVIPYEVASLRELHSPYDWHRAIWESIAHHDLPPPEERERSSDNRPYLSRHDLLPTGHRIIIISIHQPTRPGWCPEDLWRCREIDDAYFNAEKYRFSLLANPVKLDRKTRKRTPLTDSETLLAWLQRKAGKSGFQLQKTNITPQTTKPFLKQKKKNSNVIHLHTVRFDGILTATDPALFRQAFQNGIGRGKGFGLGLLLATPFKKQTQP